MRLSIPILVASLFLGVPGGFFIGLAIDSLSSITIYFLPCWMTAAAIIYYLLISWSNHQRTQTQKK